MADDHDALEQLRNVSSAESVHTVQSYLYLPNELSGKTVAQQLRESGLDVEDRLGADGISWLVLARVRMVPTEEAIGELRTSFEAIAAEHNGEYDGWEVEVQTRTVKELGRRDEGEQEVSGKSPG